jgi:hypothetical protein
MSKSPTPILHKPLVRNLVFFALVVLVSGVYFMFNRYLYLKLLDVNTQVIWGVPFHFSQFHSFVFAGIQWLVLLWYLEPYTDRSVLIKLSIVVGIIFLLDLITIALVKTTNYPYITKSAHRIFYNFIKYMASGLVAIMASVFLKFIPKKKNSPKKMNASSLNNANPQLESKDFMDYKGDITEYSENYTPIPQWWRWLFRVAFVGFSLLAIALMYKHYYRLSALAYFLGLLGIGFQLRWNTYRFMKISGYKLGLSLLMVWVLGLYASWFDFLPGALYFLYGFFVLLLTNSTKEESVFRGIFTILNLLLGIAGVMMYFFFGFGK